VDEVVAWLLDGDPAIRWQVERDLLGQSGKQTRRLVASHGWGAQLLSHRRPDGSWPDGWYDPKWTSTFYSLQLLQQLGVPAPESVNALLAEGLRDDGEFALWPSGKPDACVTAMMLTMANEAGVRMPGALDQILAHQMPDGGWNCRRDATHASFHTTLSTLEALAPLEVHDAQARRAGEQGREFLLAHQLYRSHRTGKVVRDTFTRFSFPCYWYFDVLRALDYWRGFAYDPRLDGALGLLIAKRRKGTWTLQNKHPGRTWFDMETPGRPSRWNTLRALRVLQWAGA
jgi:hypothetical protein